MYDIPQVSSEVVIYSSYRSAFSKDWCSKGDELGSHEDVNLSILLTKVDQQHGKGIGRIV